MTTRVENKQDSTINNFIHGGWSIIVFITIILVTAIIQMALFIFTNYSINGMEFGEEGAWVTWVFMFVSIPFGICAVLSMILSIRKEAGFMFYALVVEAGYMISGLAAGMMITSLVIPLFSIVNYYRYNKIKKYGPNYEVDKDLWNKILIGCAILILLVGTLSIELDNNNSFWWNEEVYGGRKYIQYIDVVTAIFTLCGVLLTVTRNKYSFLMFIFCDLFFLILFINAHQWTSVVITIIYLCIETLGFIVWHNEHLNE